MAKEKDVNVILSGTVLGDVLKPCRAFVRRQEHDNIEVLKSPIEEADGRIILHIDWSLISMGFNDFIIVANDTDVLVSILHYNKQIKDNGLRKLWIRIGSGAKRRLIPLHHL